MLTFLNDSTLFSNIVLFHQNPCKKVSYKVAFIDMVWFIGEYVGFYFIVQRSVCFSILLDYHNLLVILANTIKTCSIW